MTLVHGDLKLGDFKTGGMMLKDGSLLYLEKNRSQLERPLPGTNIILIFDAHDSTQVIGVRIKDFEMS